MEPTKAQPTMAESYTFHLGDLPAVAIDPVGICFPFTFDGELHEGTTKPTLAELQEGIGGGFIQIIRLTLGDKDKMLVCDEEAKIKGLDPNRLATQLCHGGNAIFEGDYISGTILILDPALIK